MARVMWAACAAVASSLGVAHADFGLDAYGDLDGKVTTTGTRTSTADGFSAAHFDLFATASTGRWSFLSEILFEAGTDNTFALDVERVQVSYLYKEWLRIAIGRFHAAIGYYNDAYHHGTYFMVPVARPSMVEFEDGGGLIPAHNVGFHADGRFEVGEDHIRYDLEIANGRGADPLVVQNNRDTNIDKSLNLRLRYEPGGVLDGLVIGGNAYYDSIPGPDIAAAGVPTIGAIREILFGAHAAYVEHDMHFIAEALAITHQEVDNGARHHTYAAFAEVGHTFDKLTPYARYEWTRLPPEGDPYYRLTANDSSQAVSIGVRHLTNEYIAVKGQLGVTVPRGADPIYSAIGQIAFAF